MKLSNRLVSAAWVGVAALLVFCLGFAKSAAQPAPEVTEVKAAETATVEQSVQPEGLRIEQIDPRYDNLKSFFDKYKCPEPRYINVYIEEADKNNIDYRLLPAISLKESTCGKFVPHWCPNRVKSHNYWGYGKRCWPNAGEGIKTILSEFRSKTPWSRADGNVSKILYYYNGTVEPAYPSRVINLMNQIEIK